MANAPRRRTVFQESGSLKNPHTSAQSPSTAPGPGVCYLGQCHSDLNTKTLNVTKAIFVQANLLRVRRDRGEEGGVGPGTRKTQRDKKYGSTQTQLGQHKNMHSGQKRRKTKGGEAKRIGPKGWRKEWGQKRVGGSPKKGGREPKKGGGGSPKRVEEGAPKRVEGGQIGGGKESETFRVYLADVADQTEFRFKS